MWNETNKKSAWRERLETIIEETLNKIISKREDTRLTPEEMDTFGVDELDPLVPDVLKMMIETSEVSIAKVQRNFGLGFSKAVKIVDQIEACGFITEPNPEKGRKVLIAQEEYKSIFEKE